MSDTPVGAEASPSSSNAVTVMVSASPPSAGDIDTMSVGVEDDDMLQYSPDVAVHIGEKVWYNQELVQLTHVYEPCESADILYDDGDFEALVPAIRLYTENGTVEDESSIVQGPLSAGQRIRGKWKDGVVLYDGQVVRVYPPHPVVRIEYLPQSHKRPNRVHIACIQAADQALELGHRQYAFDAANDSSDYSSSSSSDSGDSDTWSDYDSDAEVAAATTSNNIRASVASLTQRLGNAFKGLIGKRTDKLGDPIEPRTPTKAELKAAAREKLQKVTETPEEKLHEDVRKRWRRGSFKAYAQGYRTTDPHQFDDEVLPQDCEYKGMVGQWMSKAIRCSSEYSASWGLHKALGKANVYPRYGDNYDAWAPQPAQGTIEFVHLQWEKPVCVSAMEIYETFNPGGIISVQLEIYGSEKQMFEEVWKADHPTPIQHSVVFRPKIRFVDRRAIGIKLVMDTRMHRSWQEIDAIRIFSTKQLKYLEHVPISSPENVDSMLAYMLCCQRRWKDENDDRFFLPREMWDHVARHLGSTGIDLEDKAKERILFTPKTPTPVKVAKDRTRSPPPSPASLGIHH